MDSIFELSAQLGRSLSAKQWLVTTAESCTGGGIAQAITDVAGSSQWFSHGFVTYSNHAKEQLLGVSAEVIAEHGAVSQSVVELMAVGAINSSKADLSIAVSGIAGPGGGSAQKPVGTVWIAWAVRNHRVLSECFLFSGDRKSVRNQTIAAALKKAKEISNKNTV